MLYKDGRNYVIAVDYYSKFFELEELVTTQVTNVDFFDRPFAWHSIPDVVR